MWKRGERRGRRQEEGEGRQKNGGRKGKKRTEGEGTRSERGMGTTEGEMTSGKHGWRREEGEHGIVSKLGKTREAKREKRTRSRERPLRSP